MKLSELILKFTIGLIVDIYNISTGSASTREMQSLLLEQKHSMQMDYTHKLYVYDRLQENSKENRNVKQCENIGNVFMTVIKMSKI